MEKRWIDYCRKLGRDAVPSGLYSPTPDYQSGGGAGEEANDYPRIRYQTRLQQWENDGGKT